MRRILSRSEHRQHGRYGAFAVLALAATLAACGEPADTRWWVTFTEASVEQLERARAAGLVRPGSRAFVRWRAAMTDERVVGPGGPALLVREILELRPDAADDC